MSEAAESHDYTMKIVPTIYEDVSGNVFVSYQATYAYSVIKLHSSHQASFFKIIFYLFFFCRVTCLSQFMAVHRQQFGSDMI